MRVVAGTLRVSLASVALAATAMLAAPAQGAPTHGIAMHGEPALPADFDHLPYANPDAPKGGRITFANVGAFDSMNPFILLGSAPRGIWDETWGHNVWDSLLARNRAEPFTLYGLLAESVEVPDDRSWVEFKLRSEARFSDGSPVTPADVAFTAELLRAKGLKGYRDILNRVSKVEAVGEGRVRYTFKEAGDREAPMIIGLLPVLAKHDIDPDSFDKTSFRAPLGSGPYLVASVYPGRGITLKRRLDYWGKDLPLKRGFDNFDEIRVDYYRDSNTYFDAFKKGLFDVLPESDPTRWASAYDFPAVRDGRIVLEKFADAQPKPMIGFVFNTRRPMFADPRVREALAYCLDFEWLNRALYYGLYRRTGSYFEGSELSALGRPASDRERALLAPYAALIRPDALDGTYRPPTTDGSGYDRANLHKAVELLASAGYVIRNDVMVKRATGEPLTFTLMAKTKEQENLGLAFGRTLALIGVGLSVRRADPAQYELRLKNFDFDMIQFPFASSLSPGNEQVGRWKSAAAKNPGTRNFAGTENPAVDAMIDALLAARGQDDFVAAVRALDRALISGFYVVPLFYAPESWWARWVRIQHPSTPSLYGAEPTTWWAQDAAAVN